jgi:hypothetical protein
MIDTTNIKQYLLDNSMEEDGPLDTPCLVWLGACSLGYGRIQFEGRSQAVHRVAYQIEVGPIPKGRLICHRCDNPPCFRISHLYCGTHATNRQDFADRGSLTAKLSKEVVLEIRQMAHDGRRTQEYIAACFGINQPLVSIIARGLARPEVGGPLTFRGRKLRPKLHFDLPGAHELVNEIIEASA